MGQGLGQICLSQWMLFHGDQVQTGKVWGVFQKLLGGQQAIQASTKACFTDNEITTGGQCAKALRQPVALHKDVITFRHAVLTGEIGVVKVHCYRGALMPVNGGRLDG